MSVNDTKPKEFAYTFYIIEDLSPDPLPPYYGSTRQTLCKRMYGHKCRAGTSKSCSSTHIITRSNFQAYALKEMTCSRMDAKKIEAEYIRENNCINKRVPQAIDAANVKEWGREYRRLNKDRTSKSKKQYYLDNKEKILTYQNMYNAKKRALVPPIPDTFLKINKK